MRPLTLLAPIGCALLTASCATRLPNYSVAPRLATPVEAARPCRLYRLPAKPTQADLELGYATRGADLVACDAARRLMVETHEAEHALEDRLISGKAKP